MLQTYELLKIEDVTLDLNNPRIKRLLEVYGPNPSAEAVKLALGAGTPDEESKGTTFQSLKESIRTNGGIIHPIIVNRISENSSMIVIEGNTRLAIYKEFKENGTPGHWDKIPAIVYVDLESNKIDAIRLQAHLVGPRDWDPYSKAKYLHWLSTSEQMKFSQIVDFCGGREHEVKNFIAAYLDMEKYYREALDPDSTFDTTRFSAFVELQRGKIKNTLLKHGFTITDFSKWVIDQLIYPLNTVRSLPQILSNQKSRSIFLKDGAREALKALSIGSNVKLDDLSIEELARALYDKLNTISHSELKQMKANPDSEKVMTLINLKEELEEDLDFVLSGEG